MKETTNSHCRSGIGALHHIIPFAAVVAFLVPGVPHARSQITWNGLGADKNWSTAGNWDGGVVPGSASAVLFNENGTDATQGNVNNIVDGLFSGTVVSLQYAQTNLLYHTTLISPGKTLTILGNFIAGTEAAAPNLVTTINGPGAALVVSNPAADFVVRQGNSASSSRATLDLSGLDSLTVDVNRVIIGRADPPGLPNINRNTGWLYLARTNLIKAATANTSLNVIGVEVGRSGSNNGNGSRLYLGQTNVIFASSLSVGMEKETGCQMVFNNLFTGPVVFIRGTDGSSRMGLWTIGDGESNSGTTSCQGTADFTGGTVDALVDSMTIGRASSNTSGTGNSRGTLTMDHGTIDINTLQVGLQTASTGKNGDGTVNVNGGTLRVNTLLELGHGTGGAGLATTVGRLNINGGTVIAGQIVCGIGGTQITLNAGGQLQTPGPIGTVAAPVGTFTVGDVTLPLAPEGTAPPVVVSNLVTAGVQNIINITALPPIAQYPVTLPLISYQGGYVQGLGNNFVLGSLPTGSPAYQGAIVDTGTAIALQLTGGPTFDLKCTWTGAIDANWDMATLNWINKGAAAAFVPSGDAYFTDTATRTNVTLAEALEPGSITVSNLSVAYTFSGTGQIAASGRLVKDGTGSAMIANQGTNNFNTVNVKAGTLQFGDGGTNGLFTAGAITNDGSLVIDLAANLRLGTPIAGTGSVTKTGVGLLTLAADSGYTGDTLVAGGTLAVNSTLSGGGKLSVSPGGTLTGSGFYTGPVQSGGVINPGAINSPGLLRISGNLTMVPGGILEFDLNGSNAAYDPAINDALELFGTLALNNTTIRVNLQNQPQTGVPYLVVSHNGIASGSFNPIVSGTHYQASLDTTTSPSLVYVTFNSNTGFDLKWASTTSGVWDAYATNWVSLASSQPTPFYAGDAALFDDTPGVVTNLTIDTGVTVTAAGITNRSDANNFTISGGGRISGPAGVQKEGRSTLTLQTANNFTGPVNVLGGTLRTGTTTALGTTATGTTVSPGATLDINGQNLGSEPLTAGGAGVGGKGAIVNTGPDQTQALRVVALTGDTVFGGTGRWDIRNATVTLDPGIVNPIKLTKVGTNQFSFVATTLPALLGDVDVQEGIFAIQTTTAQLSLTANGLAFGDPSRTITVHTNATLNLWALGVDYPLDKIITLQDGATLWNDSGTCVVKGPVTLQGAALFNIDDGTTLVVTNTINGPGNLTKGRGGILSLGSVNGFSGDAVINGGTLALVDAASISGARSITVANGAVLDASARANGTLTLASPQVLSGNGAITGTMVALAGATVAPGAPMGALTVSGSASLGGTTRVEINSANTPNCGTLAAASITFGGTLIVTNSGPALKGGESFRIFNSATACLGGFDSVQLPGLGAGLSWDTNQMASTGTLLVSGTLVTPTFSTIALSDGNLVISGTDGIAGSTYYVLTSTNLAQPNWTPVYTNTFRPDGSFSLTNVFDSEASQRYYRIQLP